MAVDLGDAIAEGWRYVAGAAGVIGAALGINRFRLARQKALDERFAGLATKEQVERHKEANDAQIGQARSDITNLYRLNEKQTDILAEMRTEALDRHIELLKEIHASRSTQ